ncbi:hypothetical protein HRbin06_00516 [archaeon HR06]|nr:hypothetical protein HRbin06_00516 [archaeon HR06]
MEIPFLIAILIILLIAPLISKRIEYNLEIFFFFIALLAITVVGKWSEAILLEAILAPLTVSNFPLGIFQVVIIAGIIFAKFEREFNSFFARRSNPLSVLAITLPLSLLSSVISVIVASVILSEVIRAMKIGNKKKVLILGAYSLGLGAALTPIGEPLSTIAVHKLAGDPYHANFFFLFNLLSDYIIPIILILNLYLFLLVKRSKVIEREEVIVKQSYREVLLRGFKIYLFIFSLILLGESFEPLVEEYIKFLTPEFLYLFGIISSAVDNATLTAAIISPELTILQIKSFLISLLISGGFLIPGNIPNIIIAYIHKIGFKDWAKEALPIGLPLFFSSFFIIFFIKV